MRMLLLLTLSATMSFSFAETALRDDGKQVELNANGTWTLLSEDVLATSTSGLRVRLSPDGNWQPLDSSQGNVVMAGKPSLEQASFNTRVSLEGIQIQKVKVSRASSKNTVFEQNLLAYLQFDARPTSELLNAANFTVSDSKGVNYPIIAVNTEGNNGLFVRAEGAPDRWSRTKSITVSMDKQLLSTLADINLSADFRDIKTTLSATFVDELSR